MSFAASHLHLKVQQVEQVCWFELSWGQGQQITAAVPYPVTLTRQYHEWQRSYLSFYKSLQHAVTPAAAVDTAKLRGRVVGSGSLSSTQVDWHSQLVQTEAKLLYEFHRWLRSAELFELRSRIAQTNQAVPHSLDLFLTCTPLDLARLPWETWEIGSEFGATRPIRLARMPTQIRAAAEAQSRRQGRTRVLAILGDDTGLDFQADQAAVRSLSRVAEVQFIGWQPGQNVTALKQQICHEIADERGWDVLFFAGHSNEMQMTGGEVGIAPGVAIAMSELAPHLRKAKARGLQFALFNSCSGLHIAETLIDLGLSQVAVMREPIHNQVAQDFLMQFLQGLAAHQDVHTALRSACQFLKLEKNLTYPSAYLIPSLFRHPEAPLFRIQPIGWKQWLRELVPKPWEAIALLLLLGLSWQVPIQGWLLDQRMLVQALYRQMTRQIPQTEPSLLLVQIDNQSLVEDGISNPRPMDRTYLARLVAQAAEFDLSVIGVDYVLDRPQGEGDQRFAEAVEQAVNQRARPILAATRDDMGVWLPPESQTENPSQTWFGDIRLWGNGYYLSLMPSEPQPLPFSYQLAIATLQSDPTADLPLSRISLAQQLQLTEQPLPIQIHPHPITEFAYGFGQLWLHPVVDFSVPPERVYARIPAWEFLRLDPVQFRQHYPQRSLIIMPGGYGEAGVSEMGEDNLPVPAAVRYWRRSQAPADPRHTMPGGEVHAYGTYHLLHDGLVVPIPDLWLIGAAIGMGYGLSRRRPIRNHRSRRWILLWGSVVLGYGWLSLQVYLSAAVLLPWLFPTLTLGLYLLPPNLPPTQRNAHDSEI